MKKLFLVSLLLSGCAAFEPSKEMDNPKCIHDRLYKITQVVDDGFLLTECHPSMAGWLCTGPDAFHKENVSIAPWNSFAEGMYLKSISGTTCLVQSGTYKYTTVLGVERTIVNLVGDYTRIPVEQTLEETKE